MRLRRSTLGERDRLPFCNKLLGRHRAGVTSDSRLLKTMPALLFLDLTTPYSCAHATPDSSEHGVVLEADRAGAI